MKPMPYIPAYHQLPESEKFLPPILHPWEVARALNPRGVLSVYKPTDPRDRQRVNIVAVVLSFFLPVFVFSFVYTVMSFYTHYSAPGKCIFLVAAAGVVPLVLGAAHLLRSRKTAQDQSWWKPGEPNWLAFLCVATSLAWLFGFMYGDCNFRTNSWQYYEWMSLNFYPSVDPPSGGAAFMDAGRIVFTQGARVDRSRPLYYKHVDTYCIAPVVSPTRSHLGSYDFWVTGLNCCGRHTDEHEIDFQCGEDLADSGGGGIRVLDSQLLPFYRLAVEQAQSKYNLTSNHPIFLTWSKDPIGDVGRYAEWAVKCYFLGLLLCCGFNLMLVLAMLGVFVHYLR